jgi:hypothetical protein
MKSIKIRGYGGIFPLLLFCSFEAATVGLVTVAV